MANTYFLNHDDKTSSRANPLLAFNQLHHHVCDIDMTRKCMALLHCVSKKRTNFETL